MDTPTPPEPYESWRTERHGRAEDAACLFGWHLIRYCREEALKSAKTAPLPLTQEKLNEEVAKAVDKALHNVMALFEGFFPMPAGPHHRAEYVLTVCIRDGAGEVAERIDIAPAMLDLPIGFWKWKDWEFR